MTFVNRSEPGLGESRYLPVNENPPREAAPNPLSADVISTLQETRMSVRCRAPDFFRNLGGNAE